MDDEPLVEIHDGDHACILFSDDEAQRRVVSQFLVQGLGAGQRVVNLPHAQSVDAMREILRRAGADVEACEATGQLTIDEALTAYAPDGRFDPERMVRSLEEKVAQAAADGWDGMRGSGDMGWALEGIPGSDRIMEYEMALNEMIPGSHFRALCQYDMRTFPAQTLLDVLRVHPVAFVGTQQLENFYYTPPAEVLDGPRPEAQLARWIGNLQDRQTSEARRRGEIRRQERLRRLQEEMVAKDGFLNAAAHELATPLTPVSLQMQYLRAQDPGSRLGDHQQSIDVLHRGFQRLQDIVDQLLESVRTQGVLQLHVGTVDLCRLAAQSIEAFEAPARQSGITVHLECAGAAIARVDKQRIGRVLDNLLANGMQVTPSGGTVTLQVREAEAGWEIVVTDTGIGLDADQTDRMFQPFAQVHDPMGSAQHGPGLGLFISRNIIERHGGRMWAKSAGPARGAEVGFWIPASATHTAPEAPWSAQWMRSAS